MLGRSQAAQFPLDHVEDEPKHFNSSSAAIVGAIDFLFVLGQGSGWHGFDTLKIDASGQAELVFGGEDGGTWRRATFRLSTAELAGLERELAVIDVFALKRGYFARVDDGTQWFVRARAAQQRKTVVLDNHFPEAIVRVADHVRTRIVAAHRDEITAATPLTSHGKLDEPMRWPEDVPARSPTP
jgi:hypothetical protein